METVTLNNGQGCPVLGFGTYMIHDPAVLQSALDIGYRHIDTAHLYGNEKVVGDALRTHLQNGRLKRGELFVTTKLSHINMRRENVVPALRDSLQRLGLDYVDLYLIHGPTALQKTDDDDVLPKDEKGNLKYDQVNLEETWKGMEECVDVGLTRGIGLSHFNPEQTERICLTARILPVTNQVELHPYLPQKELQAVCLKHNIVLTAFSSLGSPGREDFWKETDKEPILLEDPLILELARKHQRTRAQVAIRYGVQRNTIVIPKSENPQRQRENTMVFDFQLSEQDMDRLDSLGINRGFRYFKNRPFMKHPEYPLKKEFGQ